MLCLLGYGVTSLHAQFTLRHGKVLEQFAVLGFFEQFLAFSIVELDASALLLDDSLHVLRLDSHLVIVFTDRVTALGWCRLGYDHQRHRFQRQVSLRRSPDADDVVVDHFEADHLGLSAFRSDRHLSALGLHHGSRHHAGYHPCRYHHTDFLHYI